MSLSKIVLGGQGSMVTLWLCTPRAQANLFPEVGPGFLPVQMWGWLVQEKGDSSHQDFPGQSGKWVTNPGYGSPMEQRVEGCTFRLS